jgi:hypothetical protein
MRDGKTKLLLVLGAAAIASLVYGIVTPGTSRKKGRPQPEAALETTVPVEALQSAPRSFARGQFETWEKSPFIAPNINGDSGLEKLTLNGIVWDSQNPTAMINDGIVAVGDTIGGWTVVSIQPTYVTVNDGKKDLEIRLNEDE